MTKKKELREQIENLERIYNDQYHTTERYAAQLRPLKKLASAQPVQIWVAVCPVCNKLYHARALSTVQRAIEECAQRGHQ